MPYYYVGLLNRFPLAFHDHLCNIYSGIYNILLL